MDSINNVYRSIQWLSSYFDNREKPKFLLDPLTTIIKISMLKYKSANTKIRICEHKVYFSEPGYVQGLKRWIMGDSRSNIHYLYLPILYFCHMRQGIESQKEGRDLDISPTIIQKLTRLTIAGLQELKKTYVTDNQKDLVIGCLDLYLMMLRDEGGSQLDEKYNKINTTTKKTYEEFLKCWRKENVEIISQLFDETEKVQQNEFFVSSTLNMIDSYLDGINHSIDKLRDP